MIDNKNSKKIGITITHHFHKHKKNITKHVIKHHKKYIWGLGVVSGMTTFKILILVFSIGLGLRPQTTFGDTILKTIAESGGVNAIEKK